MIQEQTPLSMVEAMGILNESKSEDSELIGFAKKFVDESKIDAKVDLAFLFITLCCILLIIRPSVKSSTQKSTKPGVKLFGFSSDTIVWILCGSLIGYSMGIKYITLLSIFAYLIVIFYKNAGKSGAVAIFFLNFALIFLLDLPRFGAFEKNQMLIRILTPFILALIAFFFALRINKKGLLAASKKAIAFCISISILFLPWAISLQ